MMKDDENKHDREQTGNVDQPEEEIVSEKNAEPAAAQENATHKDHKMKKVKIQEAELNELRAKAKKLDELQDTFVRRVADFENAKKRLVREKEEFAKFANEKIIAAFLPVIDNLDRALSHVGDSENNVSFTSGIALIKKQVMDILQAQGLEKIESVGKPFDPHVHEAMGTVASEEYPEDTVVEEIQVGYVYKEKLLRPSWVRVSAGAKSTDNADDAPEDNS
jgi:molecular chaperone GrpE